jgi:hypothetical protein
LQTCPGGDRAARTVEIPVLRVSRQICQELTRLHDFCVQLTLLRRLNGTVTRRQRDLFFVQPSRAIFVAGPGDQISRPAFHQRTSLP